MKRSKTGGAMALQQQQVRDGRSKEVASVWRPTNLRVRRMSRGPTTPVPSWKLYENPFYDGVMQAAAGGARNVSARKLAASLWEMQEVPLPGLESSANSRSPEESTGSTSKNKPVVLLPSPPVRKKKDSQQAIKSTDSNARISYTNRQLAAMQSHIHRLLDKQSSIKNSPSSKQRDIEKQTPEPSHENKPSLEAFPATSELLERLQTLEQQHSGEEFAEVLRTELDAARGKVKELEGANRFARREIEVLLKKIAEEKTSSFGKEQEKVSQALEKVRGEADDERKVKRRMELANKKLARELGEARLALSKAMEELEKERKARQLMEDVCDELAREIGNDKAEVEELKRESSRIKQEVEEERSMLQMAEVWREERVQMKLSEAREEIQAKLGVLENLRERVEEFLRVRKRVLDDGDYSSQQADIREAEILRAAVEGVLARERDSSVRERSDETDDDLHSIDLTREVSSSRVVVEKNSSWSKLVEEHRQKMLKKKIYCSPNEEEVGSELVGGGDEVMVMNVDSLRVNPSRSDRSGDSFLESSDSSSDEFDHHHQQQQQQQQQRCLKPKSSANGYGRNLKCFVEWTRHGAKSNKV